MAGTIDHFNFRAVIDSMLLSSLDNSTARDNPIIPVTLNLANGTSSAQASQHWHDTRTLSASATEDLDFAASLTNAFGVTLTFVRIKFIYIVASTGNTNDVQVTRKSTTGIPLFMADGDGIALGPGEWFMYGSPTTGKAVTATTDDTLTFTNSAGSTSVTYSILVAGTD